ncbi:VTT domain-containing protein [Peribacillus castrilensis]|uniref:TVP38/TMEM64 family protein n=1 Tax=Peribacillus TaxID=2675229 RepID=UPI001F4E126A|nr:MULTISPECIES: VTT domain-containing protein [unclassified Peribacillus]MCK1982006.1 VTT domain-containing protein [Peribacillus sp. Aquil_B1]MCK2007642.1 VTT domain-containing protein [Peribacillus sp. Aquil_B8]
MDELVLYWFSLSGSFSIMVSILLNIVISIFGVIPSFFLTASNITFYGYEKGIFISYIGECLGAGISFLLYRKGIQYVKHPVPPNSKYLNKLMRSKGKEAAILIVSLRLLPFMPSGLINLGAALSKINILHFTLASAIGKIPAMLIEGYSVNEVLSWETEGKVALFIVSLLILVINWLIKRKRSGV